jgi:adenosylcobinamide-GDP ribazoletransferase
MATMLALVIVGYLLRVPMWKPVVAASVVTLLTGLFYKHRLGGITGDCFGATIQLSMMAVLLCGVWK